MLSTSRRMLEKAWLKGFLAQDQVYGVVSPEYSQSLLRAQNVLERKVSPKALEEEQQGS